MLALLLSRKLAVFEFTIVAYVSEHLGKIEKLALSINCFIK